MGIEIKTVQSKGFTVTDRVGLVEGTPVAVGSSLALPGTLAVSESAWSLCSVVVSCKFSCCHGSVLPCTIQVTPLLATVCDYQHHRARALVEKLACELVPV